jgi:flagellar hook-associated protein 3 FlgL
MRITFNSQYRDAAAGIEEASSRLGEYQRQVSTGRRIEKPSDDPSGSAILVTEKSQLARVEQYERASDSVKSRMTVVDTVLSDIIQKLSAAQTSAQSARGSLKSADEREAAAQDLEGIRAALLSDMNTSFRGSYVFAGAASTTIPYTVGGGGAVGAYAGSTTEVTVDIGRPVTVGFNGDTIVKGSDAQDVFAVIDALVTAVRAGDNDGITTGMDGLGRAMTRATTAQMRVGVALRTIEGEQVTLQETRISTAARVDTLEAVDMAEAISGMTQADAAYRAALGAVGTAARVSLMDYLG